MPTHYARQHAHTLLQRFNALTKWEVEEEKEEGGEREEPEEGEKEKVAVGLQGAIQGVMGMRRTKEDKGVRGEEKEEE